MDMETDMEMEMNMETETDMESESDDTQTQTCAWNLGTFAQYLIQCNSPYRAEWINSDITAQFQRPNKPLAPFHVEKMTCRFSEIHTATGTALQPMC